MLLLSVLLIALVTVSLPFLVKRLAAYMSGVKLQDSYDWLPVLAGFLFLIAWFIPNIYISNQTSTFQQHFVGGGMYSACLYVYFKKLFGWKLSLLSSLIVLFAAVSTLGVANELMEFTLTKMNLARVGTGDTDWDLLANTLGAFLGYGLLVLTRVEKLKV